VKPDRVFFVLGALSACLAVAAGAFGAHALRGRIGDDLLAAHQTGVLYHLVHSLGLLAAASARGRWPGGFSAAGGWLLAAGTVLFSGSLYALALTGVRALGAVTPIGGICFLLGWLSLAWAAFHGPDR
jgi:uncharacterized membrane protein YgdD (TMEM256/DUF423 family)